MTSLDRFTSTGRFLRKEDIPDPPGFIQATIASTGEHAFDAKLPQLVLGFSDPAFKPFVCNGTNARLLQTEFGVTELEQLLGLTIEIYIDRTVMMRGQIVGGLRIRRPQSGMPSHSNAAPPQPPTAAQQQPAPAQRAPWEG